MVMSAWPRATGLSVQQPNHKTRTEKLDSAPDMRARRRESAQPTLQAQPRDGARKGAHTVEFLLLGPTWTDGCMMVRSSFRTRGAGQGNEHATYNFLWSRGQRTLVWLSDRRCRAKRSTERRDRDDIKRLREALMREARPDTTVRVRYNVQPSRPMSTATSHSALRLYSSHTLPRDSAFCAARAAPPRAWAPDAASRFRPFWRDSTGASRCRGRGARNIP